MLRILLQGQNPRYVDPIRISSPWLPWDLGFSGRMGRKASHVRSDKGISALVVLASYFECLGGKWQRFFAVGLNGGGGV